MKVFIDTSIPMYASGKEHPLKRNCINLLEMVAGGKLEAYTDSEVFQEILYRYHHIKQNELGFKVFDLFSKIMNGAVLPVMFRDVKQARTLAESEVAAGLSPRDLIHLAVILNNDLDAIASTDRALTRLSKDKGIIDFFGLS